MKKARTRPLDYDSQGGLGSADRQPFWPREKEWWVNFIVQVVLYGALGWLCIHYTGGGS